MRLVWEIGANFLGLALTGAVGAVVVALVWDHRPLQLIEKGQEVRSVLHYSFCKLRVSRLLGGKAEHSLGNN